MKRSKDCITKFYHAELLSLSIGETLHVAKPAVNDWANNFGFTNTDALILISWYLNNNKSELRNKSHAISKTLIVSPMFNCNSEGNI